MKKIIITITLIFIITMSTLIGILVSNNYKLADIKRWNKEYEQYLDKEIFGTELATAINKVINENERNKVSKDEKGYYIDNGTNSIKIDLNMVTIKKTIKMEQVHDNGIAEFVKNFNFIKFKGSNIEYHKKTGKVSKIIFEETEE